MHVRRGRLLDDHGNEIQRPLNHFCVSLLQFNVLTESGQVLEGHRFVRNLRVVHDPVHDLVLEDDGFHLAHGIGILEIRTPSLILIRILGNQSFRRSEPTPDRP